METIELSSLAKEEDTLIQEEFRPLLKSPKEYKMENKFLLLTERSKKQILDYMPTDTTIGNMATFFQNFSDSTRLKIITTLCMSDLCVNDIASLLNLNQTTVSHQLQILRAENIVSYRRDGKFLLYTLEKKAVNDIMLTVVNIL